MMKRHLQSMIKFTIPSSQSKGLPFFLFASFFIFFLVVYSNNAWSQIEQASDSAVSVISEEEWFVLPWSAEDSMPIYALEEIAIYKKPSYTKKRHIRKYNRLAKKVKKVYPYSKILEARLAELEKELDQAESEWERKKLIKETEKELFAEFEEVIWKMTISEGRILVKLIDRQTGNSSYEIIREMRGAFQAFFWQSIALLFRNDLKEQYDADQNLEDKMIEEIVMRIERNETDLLIH